MKANFIGTYLQSGNNNWFCRYICMYKCWEGYNLSALNNCELLQHGQQVL